METRTSGKAIAGFVLGLIGLIPVLGFLFGILAIIFSAIAKKEISMDKNLSGNGLAIAGLVLGIADFAVISLAIFAAIAIPNFYAMRNRAHEATVKNHMHTVQIAMEDFSIQSEGYRYPTSLDSRTEDGTRFEELLPRKMENPFTRERTRIVFFDEPETFPEIYEEVDIPRGEIYVYSDGRHYVVLGGNSRDTQLSVRLTSGD